MTIVSQQRKRARWTAEPINLALQRSYFKMDPQQEATETGTIPASEPDKTPARSDVKFISNKKKVLVEEIKKTIIDHIYFSDAPIKVNFSDYLSQTMNYHYAYLAQLFLKVEGTSIRNFIIQTKIERVKELLIYEAMTLTDISFKLHYSSVAHLSNQFKQVTGSSPSSYLQFIAQTSCFLPHKTPSNKQGDQRSMFDASRNMSIPQAPKTHEGNPQQVHMQ